MAGKYLFENEFKSNETIIIDNEDIIIQNDDLSLLGTVKTNSGKTDLCQDITSSNVPENLEELEMQIDRLKRRWGEFTYLIGQRLKYINDNKLYKEKGYRDFKTYSNIALKMSENNAYYYIAVYEYFTEEQTRKAGSKLKLIIPILNKIKKEKDSPEDYKMAKIKDVRDELFLKVFNKTYREAEKIIADVRRKFFTDMDKIVSFKRIVVTKERVIVNESDKDIQKQLVALIEEFYK